MHAMSASTTEIKRLLEVLGALLIASGGHPMVTYCMGNGPSLQTIWPAALVSVIGIVVLCTGFFWSPRPVSDSRFIQTLATLASHAGTYIAMIFQVWLYMVVTNLLH